MADLKKIRLSGVTYNIVDDSALHNIDSSVTSGGTNAVQGSGIYNAITASTAAALQTVAEAGYQTSGDVQNAISGKADTSAVTAVNDALTAHTSDSDIHVTVPEKVTWNAKADLSDIPSVSGYADSVKYNDTSKYMEFYHGGTGGTKVYEFDAAPFLIDGMVENVEIKDVTLSGESVTCLVITFNTDAGKQDIDIPLTDIFDPSNYYDKNAINSLLLGKTDTSAFTEHATDMGLHLTAMDRMILNNFDGKSVTSSVTSASTDSEIPTAKAVYDAVGQGGGGVTVDQTVISGSTNAVAGGAVYDELQGKQATLVSGTNIKTVGTESILGSGNIALMTAHVGTGNDAETLILDFA